MIPDFFLQHYLITVAVPSVIVPSHAACAAEGGQAPERHIANVEKAVGKKLAINYVPVTSQNRIPLVSIDLNNSCHGAEKAQQMRNYDKRYIGVDLVNPRFDKLAEVYGARGYYVTRPQDIAETVSAALKHDGPSVIEIPVAEHFPLPAKVPGSAGGH